MDSGIKTNDLKEIVGQRHARAKAKIMSSGCKNEDVADMRAWKTLIEEAVKEIKGFDEETLEVF